MLFMEWVEATILDQEVCNYLSKSLHYKKIIWLLRYDMFPIELLLLFKVLRSISSHEMAFVPVAIQHYLVKQNANL